MTKTTALTQELRLMHEQMERLLELARQNGGHPTQEAGGWSPPVDIHEDAQVVVIDMELPGLEQHEIDVHVADGALVIQGERRRERDGDGSACQRNERIYGPFRRTFMLPAGVDAAAIQARCERGVLTVLLPKQPAAGPRQIEVSAR